MPQHLQLFDRHLEQTIDKRVATLSANCWGVASFEVDDEELARGVFSLREATVVMPDGMLVQVGSRRAIPGVTVTTPGTQAGKTIEVYLGVPADSVRGTPHYAGDPSAAGARYVERPATLADDYGAADDVEVDCVVPNAQLLLGDDARSDYITIKLAELNVSETGTLRVSESYVPPLLRIEASAPLMAKLSRVVNAVSGKQNSLADRYRGRSQAIVEFGAQDMVTFWYLHTLDGWLPTLMHYANSGKIHPETLYLALAGLAGQLTTFEQQIDPQGLPRYNHFDLGGSLLGLCERLQQMLGTVVSQQFEQIPLDQSQPGLFVARIENPKLLRDYQLYLVAGGEQVDDGALREQVPRFVKISALDQIGHIVQAAISGVAAPIDLSPPTAIPVRAQNIYLKLQQEGAYWDGVLRSNTLAIYQPVQPDAVQLELLAVER